LATLTGVFFDTSVLLAGLLDLGSEPAQKVMDALVAGAFGKPKTAWHCCLEFYAVSTRLPEEMRLTPDQALQLLREEVRARIEVVQLPAGAWDAFLMRVKNERIAGGRLYDAHIAEIARRHKARIVVTDNLRHFAGLTVAGIEVVTTRELAERL
jgi:predicted nucleic acid-binding protein